MSLIMDALKKAQALRSKETKGTPFLKYLPPKRERTLAGSWKLWGVIGVLSVSLLSLVYVFYKPDSSPLTQPSQVVTITPTQPPPLSETRSAGDLPLSGEGKSPVPTRKEEGAPLAPQRGQKMLASQPVEEKGPALPQERGKVTFEKVPPKKDTSIDPKKEEPLKPQRVTTKESVEENLPAQKGGVADRLPAKPSIPPIQSGKGEIASAPLTEKKTEKGLPITPPAPPKEESFSKTIGVKQEDRKEHTLAAEVLHQFNSGVSFYNQREISKAIQAYQQVIEMDPAYVEAYNNLGIIYQEMGDLESALKAYQKAVEINPRYEKGYNNLGTLYYTRGRYDDAVGAFGKALVINPNHIESHINLGVLFKKQGQLTKAIESFQKALSINPLQGEIYYNIGLLYEQGENVDLAIGHYQRFIHLSSKSHPELVSKVERHLDYLSRIRQTPRK